MPPHNYYGIFLHNRHGESAAPEIFISVGGGSAELPNGLRVTLLPVTLHPPDDGNGTPEVLSYERGPCRWIAYRRVATPVDCVQQQEGNGQEQEGEEEALHYDVAPESMRIDDMGVQVDQQDDLMPLDPGEMDALVEDAQMLADLPAFAQFDAGYPEIQVPEYHYDEYAVTATLQNIRAPTNPASNYPVLPPTPTFPPNGNGLPNDEPAPHHEPHNPFLATTFSPTQDAANLPRHQPPDTGIETHTSGSPSLFSLPVQSPRRHIANVPRRNLLRSQGAGPDSPTLAAPAASRTAMAQHTTASSPPTAPAAQPQPHPPPHLGRVYGAIAYNRRVRTPAPTQPAQSAQQVASTQSVATQADRFISDIAGARDAAGELDGNYTEGRNGAQ